MNQAIAANIRMFREHRSWTQDHLAEAACLTTRTVQRAESGQGMTAETLTAIAGAFDVTLDVLRLDLVAAMAAQFGVNRSELTPDIIREKLEEQQRDIDAKYFKVALKRVTAASAFSVLAGIYALTVEVVGESEEAQDIAAELREHLQDYIDVAHDVGPVGQREMEKHAYLVAQRLEVLGFAVSVGHAVQPLTLADKSKVHWPVGYVVITKADDVRDFAAIERGTVTVLI
jgi:transcriptional regulator with XRE-family HTH domain